MPYTPQHEREAWDRAGRVRERHAADVAHIRTRKDLSEAGRRRQLAAATVACRQQLAKIKADDEARRAARRDELERQLFTPRAYTDSATMNIRDAATRAAMITDVGQAARLLDNARQLDDHVLGQAAARRLVGLADEDPTRTAHCWELIHRWAGTVPGARDALDELGGIDVESVDPLAVMSRSAHFTPASVPELRGMNVDTLAADADEGKREPTTAEANWNARVRGVYDDSGC